MARHLEITAATGAAVYFCDAGSSWQRGTNENTNGLLRQYFPKGTVIPRLGGLLGADLTVGTVRLNIGAHPSGWAAQMLVLLGACFLGTSAERTSS
jgi:hypothetical protein